MAVGIEKDMLHLRLSECILLIGQPAAANQLAGKRLFWQRPGSGLKTETSFTIDLFRKYLLNAHYEDALKSRPALDLIISRARKLLHN